MVFKDLNSTLVMGSYRISVTNDLQGILVKCIKGRD